MTNDEKLIILATARELGFAYSNDGKLTCTLDQLCAFSVNVAASTTEQIIEAFSGVKNDK